MAAALTPHEVARGLCGCGAMMRPYLGHDAIDIRFSCCGVTAFVREYLSRMVRSDAHWFARNEVQIILAQRHRAWLAAAWKSLCARIQGGVPGHLNLGGPGAPNLRAVVAEVEAFNRARCYASMIRLSIAIHCYMCRRVTEPLWSAVELGGGANICQPCFDRLESDIKRNPGGP